MDAEMISVAALEPGMAPNSEPLRGLLERAGMVQACITALERALGADGYARYALTDLKQTWRQFLDEALMAAVELHERPSAPGTARS